MSRLLSIDPVNPSPDALAGAKEVLESGGVVALPTISFYGLCADAMNPEAIGRVFAIKKRSADKPLPLLIPDSSWVEKLASGVDQRVRALMRAFWPGALTLVLRANPQAPSHLISGEGSIGLRVPSHPVPANLLRLFNRPVTGTSANLAGSEGCADAACVQSLPLPPDLILDGGPTPGTAGSTVVDMSGRDVRILRAGLIPKKDIEAKLKPAQAG